MLTSTSSVRRMESSLTALSHIRMCIVYVVDSQNFTVFQTKLMNDPTGADLLYYRIIWVRSKPADRLSLVFAPQS